MRTRGKAFAIDMHISLSRGAAREYRGSDLFYSWKGKHHFSIGVDEAFRVSREKNSATRPDSGQKSDGVHFF